MSDVKTQNQNLNLKSNVRYRAYNLSLEVIRLVRNFPEKRVYWILGNQLLRAATSIAANLIEAKSSSSKRDFIKFYDIALKSANETKYWLDLFKDSGLLDKESLETIIQETEEVANMIGSSLLTLKGKKI